MRLARPIPALVAAWLANAVPGQAVPVPESATALLREGSAIVETRGSLRRTPEGWVFRTADAPRRDLTLLPCTLLASLETAVESSPERELSFDLSGQVFVYRGRNYVLPTHAPRLVDHVPPPAPAAPPAPAPATADSPEAMLRDLEQAVGPVARSAVAGSAPARSPRDLPPGALVSWRRGWMVREQDGAWSFVFEADATGLADPPVLLMPCLLLEAMEAHAGSGGPKRPLLLCGVVHRYRGRTWLMPTMYQVPRHTTPLRP
jgi:hypothetical protein